jgi:hypothetical protein
MKTPVGGSRQDVIEVSLCQSRQETWSKLFRKAGKPLAGQEFTCALHGAPLSKKLLKDTSFKPI